MAVIYPDFDATFADDYTDTLVDMTPGRTGEWGDIRCVRDPTDADYHIAVNSVTTHTNDARTLLYTREPPCIIPRRRLERFEVFDIHDCSDMHLFQLWDASRTYDDLTSMNPPTKSKDLCWIVSNKGQSGFSPWFRLTEWYRRSLLGVGWRKYRYKYLPFTKQLVGNGSCVGDTIFKLNNGLLNYPTDGHIVRMDFFGALVEKYPDILDLYGYGTWDEDLPYYHGPLEDRWGGLESYRYSLAIHNYRGPNYFNKVTEPFLAWCMPITWGCTNLDEYFPEDSYAEIDIEDENAPARVKEIIESDRREQNLDAIAEARRRILDEYQFWSTVENCISDIEADNPV